MKSRKPIEMGAVVKYPVSSEKSIRLMEAENTLVFAVDNRATKADIRTSIETQFKATVADVRTLVNRDGVKVAYVRFAKNTPAVDIATNLGMI